MSPLHLSHVTNSVWYPPLLDRISSITQHSWTSVGPTTVKQLLAYNRDVGWPNGDLTLAYCWIKVFFLTDIDVGMRLSANVSQEDPHCQIECYGMAVMYKHTLSHGEK